MAFLVEATRPLDFSRLYFSHKNIKIYPVLLSLFSISCSKKTRNFPFRALNYCVIEI